ncbi:MAG: ABC transporter permease [Chloroflexi bacterium]|nr:ABC transporter permease [Chloroflexota bacterium]
MRQFRSLPVIVLRRMLGNWRLLVSVVIGTLIAGAILASTVIYADAIRDLGLEHALEAESVHDLDVRVSQTNIAIRAPLYEQSRERIDRRVDATLGEARGAVVRQGTTATFYPTAPGGLPNLDNDARPRANLRFRTDLLAHTTLTAGDLPSQRGTAGDGAIEVLMGAETATANGFGVGDRIELHPSWSNALGSVTAVVVGLVEASDLDDRYWGGQADLLDAQTASWPTYLLFMSQDGFFGAPARALPSMTARYLDVYQVERDRLDSRNAQPIALALERLEVRLGATENLLRVESDLVEVLEEFDDKLFFVRIPLFVLLLQIGGVVAYYLLVVSTMLLERQAEEIATLRSRGATTAQLLVQYGFEGVLLGVLAVATGPPIAATAIAALGPTPAFTDLSGGAPLDVHLSGLSFLLAGGGALLAFGSFMVPAWQATRQTVVGFKHDQARPRRSPLFLRYYLDVALVAVLAMVFWRLRREDSLFDEPLFGDPHADPFLLATPAVAMLTAGIVFLRLFPLGLRLVAWVVARSRGVWLLVGTRALARNPTHYSRLILMLMLATGVGMFGATFSATLDRSYDDRTRYAVGADARATDLRALARQGDDAFVAALDAIPGEVVSPVIREDGSIAANDVNARIEILGVDPESFGEVAWFRSDFADSSLAEMLDSLATNETVMEYSTLPVDARQFGMWAKLPDIRARMDLLAVFRDARGQLASGWLGSVSPTDPATEEWRFFSLDLLQLRGRTGSSLAARMEAPIALQSVITYTRSTIGAQRGVILLGPAMTSTLPPTRPFERGRPEIADAPFEGATVVHRLTDPGFEVLQGTLQRRVEDRLRADGDAPPGAAASLRYEWLDEVQPTSRRGIRQALPGGRTLVYLSSEAARRLQLEPGDDAVLSVSGAYIEATYAGSFDLFPTFDANGRQGFAIVHASRLQVDANASLPNTTVGYNSVWVASDDPAASGAALAAYDPSVLLDIEGERARQEEDPLIAAGWEGILAISFAAVLLLSAIGFLIYSYLTAQQRRLEFAVLRTLGFSRAQVFGVVLLEHLFVVVAGMGLGTIVGLQVGRLMMDFFGVDESGAEVLPPFALAVSRWEIVLVWGILGAVFVLTVLAVVLLYARLALHRALRVGDA